MALEFTPDQQEYVYQQWVLLRQANRKAAYYSREWNSINDGINVWMEERGITDIVQQARIKEQSLPLQGAMQAWSFWEREAKRILGAMQGELIAVQVLGDVLDVRPPAQRMQETFFAGTSDADRSVRS